MKRFNIVLACLVTALLFTVGFAQSAQAATVTNLAPCTPNVGYCLGMFCLIPTPLATGASRSVPNNATLLINGASVQLPIPAGVCVVIGSTCPRFLCHTGGNNYLIFG